jgi:hypothetical protein
MHDTQKLNFIIRGANNSAAQDSTKYRVQIFNQNILSIFFFFRRETCYSCPTIAFKKWVRTVYTRLSVYAQFTRFTPCAPCFSDV